MHNIEFLEKYQSLTEIQKVDWLIASFKKNFAFQYTILERSTHEPEYFPAEFKQNKRIKPARICFAHGFFSSALHEVSHWCIAGKKRRELVDFGYWYEPDGRTAEQQQLFEKVEVKPQALEWMFSIACHRNFHASIDNLNNDDIHREVTTNNFKTNIYNQVDAYLVDLDSIPKDAKIWLDVLSEHFRECQPLQIEDFDISVI